MNSYYEENNNHIGESRTEEADKVSCRIVKLLCEKSFSFSPEEYISIHKRLYSGILPGAGKIRTNNITKKEWVLNGDTVLYGSASVLIPTLEYDLREERKYSYKGLSIDDEISHLALFVSSIWQNHIFSEGNTRATAVFFIKYLRTLGFSVENNLFADNSWYFRNSLVRANYNNYEKGIRKTTKYLELF